MLLKVQLHVRFVWLLCFGCSWRLFNFLCLLFKLHPLVALGSRRRGFFPFISIGVTNYCRAVSFSYRPPPSLTKRFVFFLQTWACKTQKSIVTTLKCSRSQLEIAVQPESIVTLKGEVTHYWNASDFVSFVQVGNWSAATLNRGEEMELVWQQWPSRRRRSVRPHGRTSRYVTTSYTSEKSTFSL